MDPKFSAADWQRLRVLRDRFLTDASEEYWTERDLELYDATFARRIGWKWESVLDCLTRAHWHPTSTRLLDWGCGTGIASRAVAAWSGIIEATVFDQSALAMKFAAAALEREGVRARISGREPSIEPGTLLVLSHVAGELSEEESAALAEVAAQAEEVIWVEPGSRDISRRLSSAREILRAAGHRFAAPCTHGNVCPMLQPENERHWCHFFARPPTEVFQSPFWREFSTRLEIDLRSLPYSFLASSRKPIPALPAHAERMIGRPRELKAHALLLCCGQDGLHERALQKRDEPELFRRVTKKGADGIFAWAMDPDKPGRVRGGRLLDDSGA
jgi:ribosomal protein RSM22 (predicted rRNA methylase)